MRAFALLIPAFTLFACTSADSTPEPTPADTTALDTSQVDTMIEPMVLGPYEPAEPFFTPVEPNFTTTDLILPEGFTHEIIFTEKSNSVVRADGQSFPAKGYHDMNVFIPDPSNPNAGQVYTSHESRYADANLGDGGGGTLYKVEKSDSTWSVVGDYYHVDFSEVGGTLRNCGGTLMPNGHILSAEETFPPSNRSIWYRGKGIQDTSDFNGRKRYLNLGWMVEIDPEQRKALRKHVAMGRFMHEDAEFMDDGKTVYLTDDYNPAVWFKFIADEADDYTQGQLYAYQQSEDGESGQWLTMPRDTASLLNIRDIAIGMGATMFVRHEWIVRLDGKLYITETGDDDFDWKKHIDNGGKPALHIDSLCLKSGTEYDDVHGRVLCFDPATNKMSVWLEGGVGVDDPAKVFSNPDCVSMITREGVNWMVISEDVNWYTKGRVSAQAEANRQFFNELWFVDMGIEAPTVDDMHRFCVGPKGCETTGTFYAQGNQSLFMNVMHPWPRNPAPFNRSCTVVITGF